MRVLMIEDDVIANQPLAISLRQGGAVVDQLDSGEEALEMLRHYDYDIVLLDLMLTDMDGYEVVRRMRAARIDTPVLVTSALVRPQARIKAFAMGADDFITKPYDLGECVARMQAIMRRSKGFSQSMLRVGDLQLALDTREVTVAGRPVHLTGKEYAILELLVMRKGMVLTKDIFLNHLYGGMDEPEVKIIDVFICKLRKKLAEAGAANVIGTVWGRGYTVRDVGTQHSRENFAQPERPAYKAPAQDLRSLRLAQVA
jgi:two-component system cell cycle response regulator CtrA